MPKYREVSSSAPYTGRTRPVTTYTTTTQHQWKEHLTIYNVLLHSLQLFPHLIQKFLQKKNISFYICRVLENMSPPTASNTTPP